MFDELSSLWSTPGLIFLGVAALVAGVVRGFAGFGTAMVYMPVAATILPPVEALTTLVVKDLIAPLIHVPRAIRDGHPRDVLRLALGAALAVPLGVYVLTLASPELFRYGVSLLALALLFALIAGIRYRGKLTPPIIYGTGALGGFLGGSVGIPGPPVIMIYMASTLPSTAIRANNTLYLILADVILLTVFLIKGIFVPGVALLGLMLVLPYLAGNWVGAALFRPGHEVLYRRVAYVIIAVSALYGLPLWGG